MHHTCRCAPQALLAKDGSLQGQDPILHIGKTQFQNANFPMDEQGRTYHLGTKVNQMDTSHSIHFHHHDHYSVSSLTQEFAPQRGEVANKILSVGSTKRAMLLSEFLDHSEDGAHLLEVESDRGFLTITGVPCPNQLYCTRKQPSRFPWCCWPAFSYVDLLYDHHCCCMVRNCRQLFNTPVA